MEVVNWDHGFAEWSDDLVAGRDDLDRAVAGGWVRGVVCCAVLARDCVVDLLAGVGTQLLLQLAVDYG